MASVTLIGDERLVRIFRQLPRRLQTKILREEIKKAMRPMYDSAKRDVPIDEGDLKKAIKQRAMRRKRNFVGRSVLVDPKYLNRAGDDTATNRVAGLFQERGTKNAPAQPFMKPALDNNRIKALANIIAAIKTRIVAEAKAM